MTPTCRKTTRSGYKVIDIVNELETSLLSKDLERSCCLATELSCTSGGHAKQLVIRLLETYCARCVNSSHAQLALISSALVHIGQGSSQSPGDASCHEHNFRTGICTMILLIACSSKDNSRDVSSAFARVPHLEHQENVTPTLTDTLRSLKTLTMNRDAHAVSSIIRSISYDGWHGDTDNLVDGSGLGMPDVQRLRVCHRKDPVWCVWKLARDLASSVGVIGYVDHCLHVFSWGFNKHTRRSRIHLLWYAFLVIIKGAARGGPHDVDPCVLECALGMIDRLFEDVLVTDECCERDKSRKVTLDTTPSAPNIVVNVRMQYLTTMTLLDADMVSRVERDRRHTFDKNDNRVTKNITTKVIYV